MDDLRLGQTLRAIRIRRGLRQEDVAAAVGLSDASVSRLERGDLGALSVATVRRLAAVLEVRVLLQARWRGGETDRLLAWRHAALAEAVAQRLSDDGWQMRPEVSFAIYGERGVVDLLAWHAASGMLLVIELKTEIVDVGELLGTLDRKVRLAPRLARDLGWSPRAVSACVIVADSTTNRRHVRANATVLRAALPGDGRRFRGWLRKPAERLAALVYWSYRHPGRVGQDIRPIKRVGRPRRASISAKPSVGTATPSPPRG